MLEIVICGGDTISNQYLNAIIEEFLLMNHIEFRIRIFISKKDLCASIVEGFRFHIIFLDIYLPDTNGISLAKLIRRYDRDCAIILISISAEYAIYGYSVHAFDYIIKPLEKSKVVKAVAEALGRYDSRFNNTLTLRVKGADVTVNCSNIAYIESIKHYLRFYTVGGEHFRVYGKLDEFEETLKSCQSFLRCHQSYMVNMNHVKGISGRDFIMSDDSKIPIRKPSAAKLKKEYHKYAIENRF
jgi:DNA-binding LytR/AlgR family response regulator